MTLLSRSRLRNHKVNIAARLSALLLVVLSGATAAVAQTEGGGNPAPARPENPYSVNVFLHKEVEEWKIDKTLQMVADANIPYIKQEFPWQEIEFKKGYFYDDKWDKSAWEKFDKIVDAADRYKLKVIARVSHPPAWAQAGEGAAAPLKDNKDLADFTNALLDHYKGRIQYVQMWNEPNLAAEWVPGKAVDPAGYAAMMKAVYGPVKAAHPDVMLLSAPMAITLEGPEARGNMNELDYWAALYAAGIKGNFDIVSANAYGLDQPPDAAPGPKVLNFRRVELLHDIMVKNGDGDRSVWLNEYAWNASPERLPEEEKNYWRHVTEQQQAEWTVQGVEYARKNWPWAGVMSIWYFRQVGDMSPDKAEYYFRMVNPDFTTVPVYDAVKADAMRYPGPASAGSAQPTATAAAASQPTATAAAEPSATTAAAEPTATAEAGMTATPTAGAAGTPTATVAAAGEPTATTAPTGGTNVAGQDSGNTLLYVLGGVLVLAGLGGLGYYFMKNRAGGPTQS